MNLPKISTIVVLLLTLSIITLTANFLVYSMATKICLETEEVPIRWESQGLFGVLTAIPTTPQNMDEMGKICIKTGEPSFFSLSRNLEFILENVK